MQAAIRSCSALNREPRRQGRARVATILGPLPSEQDQDFALNLAVRAAMQARGGMVLYLDLTLPASQAGMALGIDLKFSVTDAIRELSRLDRVLLEGAAARDARSGLYVMALSNDFESDNAALEPATFAALLQVLQNISDVIVINYGPFSRQRALLEMLPHGAQLFLCCSQRFPSVRGAADLLTWLAESKLPERPQLVIHELAPGQVPSPAEIRDVLNVPSSIDLGTSWDELAAHLNNARPMALSTSSRYGRAIDLCLAQMGMSPQPRPDFTARIRTWLRRSPEGAAT
jgi:Flp pilus assembly CpaE family ATPase